MYIYSILNINTLVPHYFIHFIHKRPARGFGKMQTHSDSREERNHMEKG